MSKGTTGFVTQAGTVFSFTVSAQNPNKIQKNYFKFVQALNFFFYRVILRATIKDDLNMFRKIINGTNLVFNFCFYGINKSSYIVVPIKTYGPKQNKRF